MKVSALLFLSLMSSSLQAQDWKLLKTVELNHQVTALSADFQGNFYSGNANGILHKWSNQGELIEELSLSNTSPITLIEARNPLRVFVFFKETQEFSYLERLVAKPTIYSTFSFSTNLIEAMCPGTDNSIWAVESPRLSLKKVNTQNMSLLADIPVNTRLNFTNVNAIRSYRDLLILGDSQNGVLVLDFFGNQISINSGALKDFQITNDQLLILRGGLIETIHLYRDEQGELTLPTSCDHFAVGADHYVFSSKNRLFFYELLPR